MNPMGQGGPRSPTALATRRRASWVYKDRPCGWLLGPSQRSGGFLGVLPVVSPPSTPAGPHLPPGSRVLLGGHRHW